MVHNTLGLQHAEARRRWTKRKEKFPHPDAFKGFLDRAIYVVGFLTIIMTIPQIVKIWAHHDATGVSAVSWGFFLLASLFWMTYGIAHKTKPIIISYICSGVVNFLVVLGVLIYG